MKRNHQVGKFSKCRLYKKNCFFFVFITSKLSICIYFQLERSKVTEEENKLRNMLDILRIKAESHLLHWNNYEQFNEKQELVSAGESEENEQTRKKDFELKGSTDRNVENNLRAYLKSASEMVRLKSSKTAVIFLYLPKLPRLKCQKKEDNVAKAENYLENLEVLTNRWPPTLFVRGVSPVMSTTL